MEGENIEIVISLEALHVCMEFLKSRGCYFSIYVSLGLHFVILCVYN